MVFYDPYEKYAAVKNRINDLMLDPTLPDYEFDYYQKTLDEIDSMMWATDMSGISHEINEIGTITHQPD